MKILNQLISTILSITILSTFIIPVKADNELIVKIENQDEYSDISIENETETIEEDMNQVEYNNTENEEDIEVYLDDLNVQLNDLYRLVGEELHINYMYVKILHMLAGGKAIYSEIMPNIFVDTTADNFSGAFDIAGANQEYNKKAPWITCPDDNIKRPSRFYLPDAAYNVTESIIEIMNNRYEADRGILQQYFNALDNGVKTNILFCEAVLKYTGSSDDSVNSFYSIYERMLYEKLGNENVIESNENGEYVFKEKFKNILINNGISNENEINTLCCILRYDSKLASSSSTTEMSNEYVIPYTVDYTSRENLMIAAMSIVGKVRYVWGGGHGSTGAIDGINPMWEPFYNAYGNAETNEFYNYCIKPNSSWCPIHGETHGSNGCLNYSNTINSVDEYLDERADIVDIEDFKNESFYGLMSKVNFRGLTSHRLDGLDCSGYMSWLFNQITDKYNFDSGARYFIKQYGMSSIPEGNKLLPGDVFSWGDHIFMIVGPVNNKYNAFVGIESGPNTVKFCVGYLNDASSEDVQYAKEIANEANQLFGNLSEDEYTRSFNMSTLKYTYEDTEYSEFGRLKQGYIDEYTKVGIDNKRIVDMNAVEIIQYTMGNLGIKYLSGAYTYKGEIFNLDGFDIMPMVIENEEQDEIENKEDLIDEQEIIVLNSELELEFENTTEENLNGTEKLTDEVNNINDRALLNIESSLQDNSL